MYAVRCRRGTHGFRVEGVLYPAQKWLLLPEVSEAVCIEPMLEVIQVEGPHDPALAPFPATFPEPALDGGDSEHVSAGIEEMARELQSIQYRLLRIEKALESGAPIGAPSKALLSSPSSVLPSSKPKSRGGRR